MSSRKSVGLFGGTFDPFHIGHLQALKYFSEKFDFEKILVVPTGTPPHKEKKSNVSADDRMEMVRLGIAEIPNAEVWDYEIKNEGKSYSYLTLTEAKKRYPGRDLVFYTGSDMFLTLHQWRHPETILSLAKIAAFSRTGSDFDALEKQKAFLEKEYRAECFLFYEEPILISSTEIRNALYENKPCSYLPSAVEEYIKEKGLYLPNHD